MEMQSPSSSIDVESNLPPVKTDISTVNTETSDGFKIEKVSDGDTSQLEARSLGKKEENPLRDEDEITNIDYSFKVTSPLGAYDKHGVFYPDALPEGGIIDLGGFTMDTTYEGGFFVEPEEVGFLGFSSELKVGKMFPYLSYVPSSAYGKNYKLHNLPENLPARKTKNMAINYDKDIIYMIGYAITTGDPNSVLPDKVEDGVVINETAKGFRVDGAGSNQEEIAYISNALFGLTEEDGKNILIFYGYLDGNDIPTALENLPEEIADLVG
jgi:hypothetical protein